MIDVKEAAKQLSVSKSTVYRLNRFNGPFRFILESRRVYIDLRSFEAYLVEKTGPESASILAPPIDLPEQVRNENASVEAYVPSTNEPRVATEDSRPLGQRDLVVIPRYVGFIAVYGF